MTELKYPLFLSIRFVVLLLCVLAAALLYLTRINLNITIVEMVKKQSNSTVVKSSNESLSNGNMTKDCDDKFDWDQEMQGHILSSFYYGYILFQVVGGRLAEEFGAKWLCGLGIFVSGIVNLLTPTIAKWGSGYLIGSRVILGIAQSVDFPAAYALIAKWFPDQERARALGILTAGSNLGAIVTNIISGQLASSSFLGGWPAVFYVSGFVACFWFLFWILIVANDPNQHRCISKKEIDYIEASSGFKNVRKNKKIPWVRMLTSKSILTLILIKFTITWNYLIVMTKVPSFLQLVHNFPINENGNLMAAIYFSIALSMSTGGVLADWVVNKKWASKSVVRRIFECIATIGSSASLALIPLAGHNRTAVIALFVFGMLAFGMVSGGDIPIVTDMTNNYAATVIAIANSIATLAGIFGPTIVGYIINSDQYSMQLWSYVFYIGPVINLIGIIVFMIWADTNLQPWDNDNNNNDNNHENDIANSKENTNEDKHCYTNMSFVKKE